MADHPDRHGDPSRRDLFKLAGASTLLAGGTLWAVDSGGTATVASAIDADRTIARDKRGADVVVIGGGMAGTCAALAAARNGAKVILVQDRPVPGGNASSEIRMHIVGADHGGTRTETEARETGIIEELRLDDAVANPQRSASMWDLLLYDKVRSEPNIELLLNTRCYGVEMAGPRRLAAVSALQLTTNKHVTIRGKLFVDATGDGTVAHDAGASFAMGREGRDQYGESLAPPEPDSHTLGSTLLFITRKHDRPMPFKPPAWIRRYPSCDDLPYRPHNTWEYGYWWVEWGGQLDTITDAERIRDELLAAALGVWDHIKNSGAHPTSANWALEWLGFLPGKRESRRFLGDHVLTQQDLETGGAFNDAVAYGGWPIDLHPPLGIDSPERPYVHTKVPLYGIPLRSLYSRDMDNLMLAGRNISASHVAFGSTRVMATCSVIGQAVGTAAAICAARALTPRALAGEAIGDLQQQLIKDDAYLIGIRNRDAADLARGATARASSQSPDGPAANVIDGMHRGVGGASHRWISVPDQPMPQWIELRFDQPQRIREVHLVFDTGLSRALTLTHSDKLNERMVRGPQPETVREYELHVLLGESSRKVAGVEGNHQRKCVHRFEPMAADGLRLTVKATNGDVSARVFEVRAYG